MLDFEEFMETVRRKIEPAYYKLVLIPGARRRQRIRIKEIRKRGSARVTFIVSSRPMWRFQPLYDLLQRDSRFHVDIALFPFSNFSETEKDESITELRSFFTGRSIPFCDLSHEREPGRVLRLMCNPDILFYPQPYNHFFRNDLDSPFFEDCLISYIPYAMLTANESWAYKTHLNNIAWRLFYSSESRRKEAAAVLYNHGKNIRVSGEIMADVFSEPPCCEVWKPGNYKKRIIWAPHFSISDGGWMHRNSFIWLHRFMWEVAVNYQDRIQFAFKPHPRLLTELYNHPDWGKEKADAYYKQWAEGVNTQLVTGSYIDLFKESDAMIHDCGSFSVEYHYTGNPVMFTTRDLDAALSNQNDLGRAGILAHYIGGSEANILSFIEDVVLSGADPRKQDRVLFYEKYLRPPGGKSVAENIYQEIAKSIWP